MTVLQEIEDLRQKLRYYSDKYYNDDAPEIEDYQYDMMMRRLESLEQANPRYASPDSPTQKVGGKADNSFAPVAHTVRMESLQDAFSTAELRDFDRRDIPWSPRWTACPWRWNTGTACLCVVLPEATAMWAKM